MNAVERETIAEMIAEVQMSSSSSPGAGYISFWLAVIAVPLISAEVKFSHDRVAAVFCLTVALLVIVLPILYKLDREKDQRKWEKWREEIYRPQLREALEHGNVIAEAVEPTEVIVFYSNTPEDYFQNNTYLCTIAKDQVLCLNMMGLGKGDWSYLRHATPWPNTHFEIVTTVKHGKLLGVYCHGEKLKPTAVYSGSWSDDPTEWPFTEAIFAGTPQSIVRDLQLSGEALEFDEED